MRTPRLRDPPTLKKANIDVQMVSQGPGSLKGLRIMDENNQGNYEIIGSYMSY